MEHVLVAIDTSLSMDSHIASAVNGLNDFIAKLKIYHPQTFLSVVWFNKCWSYVVKGDSVQAVGVFTRQDFQCMGTTSLYDCVCSLIIEWVHLDAPTSLYIISDGDDNSSILYTDNNATDICKSAICEKGWKITHCSTDKSKLIPHTNQVRYDVDDIGDMLSGLGI